MQLPGFERRPNRSGDLVGTGIVPEQRIVGASVSGLVPIDELDIAVDPSFNVLYGLNGVGKSRLLHSLALDPELTRGATVHLHLSCPPGPIDPGATDAWLEQTPGNPWAYLLDRVGSERFPGIVEHGATAHLLMPVYEAALAILEALPRHVPEHTRAAVFRLLERTATTPQHLPELLGSATLRRFIDAALEIAEAGRFIVRLDEGYLTLDLAATRPDPHSVLGGIIAEHRSRVVARSGGLGEMGVYDSVHHELMENIAATEDDDDPFDPKADSAFFDVALRAMIEQRWEDCALETCFHPLLGTGAPMLLEAVGLMEPPAWHAASALQVHVPPHFDERVGLSVLPEWRMRDVEEIQRRTFALLPPLLLRVGGAMAPEHDFGISASSDERAVFETNTEQQAVVRDIERLANSYYAQIMDDAPRLDIVQRSPAGDTRFFMWGLLDWVATERGGNRVHVSALSDAQRRWALFAISLALELRGGMERHARLVIIDEPERGLHRLAERRLAEGLAHLGEKLSLTFVVATHSPAFLRLQHAQRLHLRRDEHGHLVPERFDGRLADPALLGLSPADRAHFVEVVVFVAEARDAAALEGFLGASMADHGIVIRVLPDVTERSGADMVEQVARLTDARILVVADEQQLEPTAHGGFPRNLELLAEMLEVAGESHRLQVLAFERAEFLVGLATSRDDGGGLGSDELDVRGMRDAAATSDRVPEVVNRVLDVAAGRPVPSMPSGSMSESPPDDVPF